MIHPSDQDALDDSSIGIFYYGIARCYLHTHVVKASEDFDAHSMSSFNCILYTGPSISRDWAAQS